MTGGNTLTLTVNAKFTGNSVVTQIKNAMKSTGKATDGVSKAIQKGSKNFNSFGSKIKSTLRGASSSFNTLKSKITNSFPVRGINGMIKKLKEMRQNSNKSGQGFDFLKGKLGMMVGAVGGFLAVSKAIDFASGSIEEYKEALVNATKLQANMQVVKAYGGDPAVIAKATASLKSQADQLERVGVYDGDLIVAGQAQLSTFQLTDKHINQLMPKLADVVANTKGMNASSEDFLGTANMFGKAITTGQLAPLKKVGITMDENTIKSFEKLSIDERVATLQRIMGENVGNVNEELAKTPLGKLRNAEIAWGNMKENIGESSVRVLGQFTPALKAITPVVETIGVGIADGIGTAIDVTKNKIQELSKTKEAGAIVTNLKAGLSSFGTSFKMGDMFGEMKTGANSAINGVMGVFSKLDFKSFGANMGSGLNSLKQAFSTLGKILFDTLGKINWNAVLQGLGLFFNAVMKVVNVIVQMLAPVLRLLWSMFATNFNFLVQIFNIIVTAVKIVFEAIEMGITWIATNWNAVWNAVVSFFTGVWANIKAIVGVAIFMIVYKFNEIKAKVGEVINNVKQRFSDGLNGLISIVQGIVDKIKNIFGGIVEKASEVVNKVKDFFKGGFKTEVTVQENVVKAPGNWTGTDSWKGGVTWVGERGKEIIQQPGQLPFVANNPMLMNLQAGTKILNNTDTRAMLKSKAETYKEKFKNSRAGKLLNQAREITRNTSNNNVSTDVNTTSNKSDNRVTNNSPVINLTINNYTNTDIRKEVEKALDEILSKFLILNGEVD